MTSFNNLCQSNTYPYHLFPTSDKGISSLASQYMEMFDISKVNPTLLRKRELDARENCMQKDATKKVKTSLTVNSYFLPGMLDPSLVLPPNFMMESLANGIGFENDNEVKGLLKMHPTQNMNLLNALRQQASFQMSQFPKKGLTYGLFPSNYNPKKDQNTENINIKEEYVKVEEMRENQMTQSSPCLENNKLHFNQQKIETDSFKGNCSEDSDEKTDYQSPEPPGDGPALAELTKSFPSWDLATIVSFIRSGKSKGGHEREKRSDKKKLGKLAKKVKTEEGVEKPKKVRAKKNLEAIQRNGPPRTSTRLQAMMLNGINKGINLELNKEEKLQEIINTVNEATQENSLSS